MRADMGVAACVVFYSSVQFDVGSRDLEELCKAYVPLLCYFFLVSAGWTTMLALRFRSSQHVPATTNKPPLPLWSVWVLPIVPAVAALVVAALVPGVTSVRTNSDRTNHACVFDPNTTQGVATDFVLYQTPLIIMLAFNMYNYLRGLLALRNAPQSVLARSMKKAGGYMSVLFLVWVPVIVYNFVAASSRHGYSYDYFFDIAVILQASQVRSPAPCNLFLAPCSLLPVVCSLLLALCCLFTVPVSGSHLAISLFMATSNRFF
jgi:hypothetical protein